jgi:hypothetical protein
MIALRYEPSKTMAPSIGSGALEQQSAVLSGQLTKPQRILNQS